MRALAFPLALLALTASAFAGCLEEAAPASPGAGDPGPKLNFTIPTLPKVDAAAFLLGHKDFVTKHPVREENAPTHIKSRDALEAQFKAANLTVWRQKYNSNNLDQENICGLKLGAVDNRTWVVVGAHYDTVTTAGADRDLSQGAYDDGSGTWIVVELAKAVAQIPSYYSIIFCAFDGEELGTKGSGALKKAMDSDSMPLPVDSTRAMLDLDMFGINWPVRTPIYATVSNEDLFQRIDGKRKEMGIPDDMFLRRGILLGQSDFRHWLENTPTVFYISDFEQCAIPTPMRNPAPAPAVPCAYPFWHFVDTVETMTAMAGGAEMSRAGFQTALDLSMFTLGIMAFQKEFKDAPEPAKKA